MAGGQRADTTAEVAAQRLMTRWPATWRGRLGLWALWVVATAAGPVLGTALALVSGLPRWPQIALILAASIAGIAVGQRLALRHLTTGVRAWVWWTTAGLVLGTVLFLSLLSGFAATVGRRLPGGGPEVVLGPCQCTFSPPNPAWTPETPGPFRCAPVELWIVVGVLLVGGVSGAVCGALVGQSQSVPLRRWAGRTAGWFLSSSAAGAIVGMLLGLAAIGFFAQFWYDGAQYHVECFYRWSTWIGWTSGPMGGLVLGGLTGISLLKLWRWRDSYADQTAASANRVVHGN